MNRQALTFTHNRDGEKLRLPERLLLAMCRPVEAPSLSVATVSYTLDNALDYATRMIPRFRERIQGKTVLDYGCGPGWQAVAMRRAGGIGGRRGEPLSFLGQGRGQRALTG